MKQCSYCGKDYPDDVERCLIDGELLAGAPQLPTAGIGAVTPEAAAEESKKNASSPQTSPPKEERGSLGGGVDRVSRHESEDETKENSRLRIIEVLLVCVIAFGGSILASTFLFFGYRYGSDAGLLRWSNSFLHEAASLGLVWYVLRRQSKSFSDLGFSWVRKDVGWSILLWMGGGLSFSAVYAVIKSLGLTSTDQSLATGQVGVRLFAGGISFVTILFQFLNPFFEELIVRAYVMTELRQLTSSAAKAVLFSTVLQMSYHFYQGAPLAFAEGAMFLIFSFSYAKSNRITPIILAHLYFDLIGTLSYYFRH